MKKMVSFKFVLVVTTCIFSSSVFGMEGDKKTNWIKTIENLENALQVYDDQYMNKQYVEVVSSLKESNSLTEPVISKALLAHQRMQEHKGILNKMKNNLNEQKDQEIQQQYPSNYKSMVMEGDKKTEWIETNDTLEKALQGYNKQLRNDIDQHNQSINQWINLNENNTWEENGTSKSSVDQSLWDNKEKLEENKRISSKITTFLNAQKNTQYSPLAGVFQPNSAPFVGVPALQAKPTEIHPASIQQNYQSMEYVSTQMPQNNSNVPAQKESNEGNSLDIFNNFEDTNK